VSKYSLHLDAKELEEIHVSLLHRKDALHEWLTKHYPENSHYFKMAAHLQRTIDLIAAIEKDRDHDDY
jgi:hypothetical protein